ncbi:hypothetical protein TVAG_205940 [Trichomonas vaginalis G3]|uniref:Uncharacterized protein n=1 Tax=Trichomonas vaginalis (strain ATCC PRA-98 / G3) TaxID=412133 RepID=A2FW53_TRIV3|nr:hypothetical protein TVAGG3_0159370 [Trichomonas vaginalis G3]EAX90874.1 hypothetical protein TVAG_205940 [Trichomonas vaginalis G3]KAI5547750.1 hypothetical protein TVAGG3_0159370 [Trichomonas vaginalis G3]|eukprot:XP_001303804.1 hypothetical protein [Trichomonas vaginalis G3]
MENAGASLFKDYRQEYKYWPLASLLYKLVVATITIMANLYVPGLMLLLTFVYVGYGVLIFFLKPFENKFNNWIEIANNGLSFIFSFISVSAAFGANVPPLVLTIMSSIETIISIGLEIAAYVIDKKNSQNEEKAKKMKELEANYLLEKPLLYYTTVFFYFGCFIIGFFVANIIAITTPVKNDLEMIPTNTCVFLEYEPKMDFLDTNKCVHLSDIKPSIEERYYTDE